MSSKTINPVLGSPKSAGQLLDQYYLHLRSALLETAAALDRIQRARGYEQVAQDPRLQKLREGCAIVGSNEPERAERFQHLLSKS